VFARVTELAGFGGRLDEYLERVREHVLPPLRDAPGYAGYLNLVDADGDRVLVVSLWRSREEMQASLELVLRLREQAAGSVGASERWVIEYEVAVRE
jgi:heme-degrading monooxygenase HmoA